MHLQTALRNSRLVTSSVPSRLCCLNSPGVSGNKQDLLAKVQDGSRCCSLRAKVSGMEAEGASGSSRLSSSACLKDVGPEVGPLA